IVASDDQAKTFTVRVKDSGQLVVLPIDQIVAGPAGALEAAAPSKQVGAPPPATGAPPEPATAPAPPVPPPAAPPTPAAPSPSPSEASGSPALASSGEPARPSGGAQEPSAPDEEAARSTGNKGPHAQSAANARPGSVLASGPGYSIKATGSKAGPPRS